jgi:xanthine dehydrogenase molybdopterin-binding subunit B
MFRFLPFSQTNKQTNKHRYNWTIPLVWAQIQADADYANRKAAVATFNTANRWKKKVGRVQHRSL